MTRPRKHRWRRAALNFLVVVGLLVAASFLPPDTSLRDRQRTGVLKVCVPPSYPPLVTGDPARPGFDIELLGAVADEIGLRLSVNTLVSIGSDFNPRNWMLTRAQCDVIAGGVADTVQTRGFLQTIPTPAETGWVAISGNGEMPAPGATIAVLPGTAGLDRVKLSGWLRANGWRARGTSTPVQFRQALEAPGIAAGIAERFVIDSLHLDEENFRSFWLPEQDFPRYRMAIGLWKGDQTLKRAVSNAIDTLSKSGAIATLQQRYDLLDAPKEQTFLQ